MLSGIRTDKCSDRSVHYTAVLIRILHVFQSVIFAYTPMKPTISIQLRSSREHAKIVEDLRIEESQLIEQRHHSTYDRFV